MIIPFDFDTRWTFPLQSPMSRTVVISDTMYQQLQKDQAQQDATVLQSKINRHKAYLADLEKELTELQETYNLLEPAPEQNKLSS